MKYYIHDLNPIAVNFGVLILPWYWLVYILGFFFCFFLGNQMRQEQDLDLSKNDLIDFMIFGWFGLLAGARIFYVVFYHLDLYLADPSEILRFWNGGMSFHGGMLGVIFSTMMVGRFKGKSFFTFSDLMATCIPFVLGFGRIANFINGELAGRVTDVPWAVIFPRLYDNLPRHPSQLYQALTEGFLLGSFLISRRYFLKSPGKQSGLFLMGYGCCRFFTEFYRTPDPQLGFILGPLTMGQLLCLLMIVTGYFVLKFHPHKARAN